MILLVKWLWGIQDSCLGFFVGIFFLRGMSVSSSPVPLQLCSWLYTMSAKRCVGCGVFWFLKDSVVINCITAHAEHLLNLKPCVTIRLDACPRGVVACASASIGFACWHMISVSKSLQANMVFVVGSKSDYTTASAGPNVRAQALFLA